MSSSKSRASLLTRINSAGTAVAELDVHISYQIIKLFSEGLYQSPHKAVEELVTNSYDAGAGTVRILMNSESPEDSLWVVDNGTGMDESGFQLLWTIAKSAKVDVERGPRERRPIGQFGIGKLAAYVLAHHLTHVSCVDGEYLYTSMNFRKVSEIDIEKPDPLVLELRSTDRQGAKELLKELEQRDPTTWDCLFGEDSWTNWTAAALSDFKDLGEDLQEGRLKWVLRTGLPLAADFTIIVNGDELKSSQLSRVPLAEIEVGVDDSRAEAMKMPLHPDGGIHVEGIGQVTGIARIYEKPLTTAKAAGQYHRNNGFFVKVRKRVINLHDDLFGLEAQNHAAWSRFYMELQAEGLQKHLLSSREGVRTSPPVEALRGYMRKVFSACRSAYEAWQDEGRKQLDIAQLLEDAPSLLVTEPLSATIHRSLAGETAPLRLIRAPVGLTTEEIEPWEEDFDEAVTESPLKVCALKH